MEIYVVQPNDTVYSIAAKFDVSSRKIIQDNQLENPNKLVPGQTIVIVYPAQTYTAKVGDTLESIAKENNISQMQLLRNNPFLSNTPVKAGDVLTIRYNTSGKMHTTGYIYPYVDRNVYKKTLPYLTYITIYNYKTSGEGEVTSYFDDTEVIQLAKNYGTIPLFMATTLSAQGEPDEEAVYSLLLGETSFDTFVDNSIAIMKQKGYLGLNIVFNYMNPNSVDLYLSVIKRLKTKLDENNFLLFVTINPNTRFVDDKPTFDKINYSVFSDYVESIMFLQFIWGTNYGPPLPVNSVERLEPFIEYATSIVPSDKILAGNTLISYDWSLPYIPGVTYANSLSIQSALRLALDVGSVIQFDEPSQSPFFNYKNSSQHVVWTVDARSIEALVNLIRKYNLDGAGFWNLMIYAAQLWLVINSQFEIIKLIPSLFD
jgi:spore germination protein YaaH